MKDLLAAQFEIVIKNFDALKNFDEKEYKKISKLFSAIVRTSPEIREMFFEEVKELSIKMRKNFEELNKGFIEEKLNNEKKNKILN